MIHMAVQSMPAKLIHTQQTFIMALFQNLKWCMVHTLTYTVQQIYTHLQTLKVHLLQDLMAII